MDARELRIGNYYKALTTNKVLQVDLFTFSEWFHNEDGDDDTTGDYMIPIPLTHEWLERFGFYCDYSRLKDGTGCYKKGWVFIVLADRGFYAYSGNSGGHISRTMQYVHQLQNLYFALTGEELELKEVSHSSKES